MKRKTKRDTLSLYQKLIPSAQVQKTRPTTSDQRRKALLKKKLLYRSSLAWGRGLQGYLFYDANFKLDWSVGWFSRKTGYLLGEKNGGIEDSHFLGNLHNGKEKMRKFSLVSEGAKEKSGVQFVDSSREI